MNEVYEFVYQDPEKAYGYFKFMICFGIIVAGIIFYACLRPPERFDDQTPRPILGIFAAVFILAIFTAAGFKASVPPGGIVSIQVDHKSLALRSILPEREIRIPKDKLEFIEIVNNRLVVKTRDQETYVTPVIYPPKQADHLQSIINVLELENSGGVRPASVPQLQ